MALRSSSIAPRCIVAKSRRLAGARCHWQGLLHIMCAQCCFAQHRPGEVDRERKRKFDSCVAREGRQSRTSAKQAKRSPEPESPPAAALGDEASRSLEEGEEKKDEF